MALPTRLSKTCAIRSRSTRTTAAGALAFDRQGDAGVLGLGLRSARPPRPAACRWATGCEVQPDPALLDPRQVEQVVDHRQQAVGVLPRRQQQLDLLGR